MIHFERFCGVLGFLVLAVALVVGLAKLHGGKFKWGCEYKTYAAWSTTTRQGVCEL